VSESRVKVRLRTELVRCGFVLVCRTGWDRLLENASAGGGGALAVFIIGFAVAELIVRGWEAEGAFGVRGARRVVFSAVGTVRKWDFRDERECFKLLWLYSCHFRNKWARRVAGDVERRAEETGGVICRLGFSG